MGIHSAFAIYGVFIYVLFLLGGGFEFVLSGSNIMDVAFRGVPTDFTTGIAAGTLISFPVAILTIAIRGLRAERQAD